MPSPDDRPLSPHLSIYRPEMTMVMSIAHRLSGIALYGGAALLAAWLVAGALGPGPFDTVQGWFGSWPGRIVLVTVTFGMMHHLLGGVRHFLWDFGVAMGPREREWLAHGTLIGSVALTILIWAGILVLERSA